MRGSVSAPVGYGLVFLHAFLILAGMALVAGMLCAAIAFGSGTTIIVPYVATFRGAADGEGSPAVTFTVSLGSAGLLVAALAAAVTAVIIGVSRRKCTRSASA